jgi:hypothetical protein
VTVNVSEKSRLLLSHPGVVGLLTLFGFVASGCAGVTPQREAPQPTVSLTLRGAVEGTSPVEPRVTTMNSDGAVITGVISTPNPCYEITATLEPNGSGRAFTVRLSAVATGGFCVQTLATFAYDVQISGMTTGSYPIDFVHTYPNTGWEDRTFRLRVTVP